MEQIALILKGAADLVGRSPYPLVEAAERLGVSVNSKTFQNARGWRDGIYAIVQPGQNPARCRLALLEAAARVEVFKR